MQVPQAVPQSLGTLMEALNIMQMKRRLQWLQELVVRRNLFCIALGFTQIKRTSRQLKIQAIQERLQRLQALIDAVRQRLLFWALHQVWKSVFETKNEKKVKEKALSYARRSYSMNVLGYSPPKHQVKKAGLKGSLKPRSPAKKPAERSELDTTIRSYHKKITVLESAFNSLLITREK